MLRAIRLVFVCAVLGGCSGVTGGMPSFTSFSGDSSSDIVARAPSSNGASQSPSGGIWSNFSSTFNSNDPPAPIVQKAAIREEPIPAFDANEALRLVNDYRASKGLHPLTLEKKATAAAESLAKDMAFHDQMSHVGPNGEDLPKRLIMAGYRYRVAAENVGVGQTSFAKMMAGWKDSPAHSRNMLLPEAKHMGIAFEYRPGTTYKTYWTLVVAAP